MADICGCEQGGDCTKTTVCAMNNALDDQREELGTLFVKYVDVVGRAEGVDFLHEWEWASEEWGLIQTILKENGNEL